VEIVDRVCWVDDSWLRLARVHYASGEPDAYVLVDRLEDPPVARAVLRQFHGATVRTEAGGSLQFRPTHLFDAFSRERTEPIAPMRGEQSNTSIRFGDALILKLFRRVQYGPHPDVEVGWFLTEHSHFRGTPAVVGSLEYISPDSRSASLALLQHFERNRGDAWTTMLRRLVALAAAGDLLEAVQPMARLGQTTAELHLALASGTEDFAAETITASDVAAWRKAIVDELYSAVDALTRHAVSVDTQSLVQRADGIAVLEGALKTRHHGDYHLGQVLEREDGSFVVIDFEGEPSKPLAQRREKRSPLRDVAGMLRSLDYARNAALRAQAELDSTRLALADRWYADARAAFLDAYVAAVLSGNPTLLPRDVDAPLAALELEKAAYEVLYELNNRPDWLPIPLAALTSA
jgi:maltose alpha-D-glucosyltransferase / alpha-amylase